jgi:hypothetical protein
MVLTLSVFIKKSINITRGRLKGVFRHLKSPFNTELGQLRFDLLQINLRNCKIKSAT